MMSEQKAVLLDVINNFPPQQPPWIPTGLQGILREQLGAVLDCGIQHRGAREMGRVNTGRFEDVRIACVGAWVSDQNGNF